MHTTKLVVVGCFVGLYLTPLAIISEERTVSVCDVLAHLDVYRGKMVEIRATLNRGYHGEFLQDAGHEASCREVSNPKNTWPPAVSITEYISGSDVDDGPPAFVSDTEEIGNALDESRKITAADKSLRVLATFNGELRARKDIQILRAPEGWYYGSGYGQNGQYPALLVLKTVRDVKIVKNEGR
jgi:hypothetical protein